MIEPGTVLAGRYRVVRHLGSGAMASVHLADDEVLGRQVAVKRVQAAPDSEYGRRVRREARIGAALRHPNLVTVYDAIAEDDALLLVMEFVPGGTLADALDGRPKPAGEALAILRPLAHALDHAHAAGVVHRDVKPANVLLGERGAVKLADLGVATSDEATQITQTGGLIGTVAYMAPEQFDPGAVTPAADVYALAAVAFELLAGRRAVTGENAFAVMTAVRDQAPPDLAAVVPGTPPAAAEALRRGMARDPADRPFTATVLVDELEAGLRARPAPEPEPAAAAAPAPAPAATPPPAAPARPARTQPPAAPPRHARSRAPAALAALLGLAAAVALVVVVSTSGDEEPRTAGPGAGRTAATGTTAAETAPADDAPAAPAATPRSAVRAFYERAAEGDLDAAWELAGPQMRAAFEGSRAEFEATLGSLEAITFERLEVVSREGATATVSIATVAEHEDRTERCDGDLRTVRDGDAWLVEPAGVRCTST